LAGGSSFKLFDVGDSLMTPEKVTPFKMKTQANKKYFQNKGVIFEVEGPNDRNSIVMIHWPYYGMDAKTARKFANWLLKRADDLEVRNAK